MRSFASQFSIFNYTIDLFHEYRNIAHIVRTFFCWYFQFYFSIRYLLLLSS